MSEAREVEDKGSGVGCRDGRLANDLSIFENNGDNYADKDANYGRKGRDYARKDDRK